MSQSVDARIQEIKNRQAGIPGRRTQYPITVEQGSTPLPATTNPNDVTDRFPKVDGTPESIAREKADREARRLHRQAPSQIVQQSNEPKAEDVITVGNIRVYPNPLDPNTYEARLTKWGMDEYVVEEIDGEILPAHAGLGALYLALKAEQQKKRK